MQRPATLDRTSSAGGFLVPPPSLIFPPSHSLLSDSHPRSPFFARGNSAACTSRGSLLPSPRMSEAATHAREGSTVRTRAHAHPPTKQPWAFAGRLSRGPALSELHARRFRGDHLRACRERSGFTRTTLAARCGLESSTIAVAESGEQPPAVLTVLTIAYVLGVSPESFYAPPEEIRPAPLP